MKSIAILILILSMPIYAEVTHTFSIGENISAEKINQNFSDLGNKQKHCILKEAVTDCGHANINIGSNVWIHRMFSIKEGDCSFLTEQDTGTQARRPNGYYFTGFDLFPGTYRVEGNSVTGQGYYVVEGRLQDVAGVTANDSDKTAIATSIYNLNGQQINRPITVKTIFSINETKKFTLQQRVSQNASSYAFGHSNSQCVMGENTIFAVLEITKLE